MNNSFSTYCNIKELCESHSLYIPENFDWVKPYLKIMPKIDINIPLIQKQSKIYQIQKNKNPIAIHFEDGAKIYCNIDEFKRLPQNLTAGNVIQYTMFNRGFEKPMIVKSFKIIS